MLTRLCLGLNHLKDRKFKRNRKDCITPICSSGHDIETITHFLLHSNSRYTFARQALFNEVNILDSNILERHESFTANFLQINNPHTLHAKV